MVENKLNLNNLNFVDTQFKMKTRREILQERVLDDCMVILKDGPKLELETVKEIREYDKPLRAYDSLDIDRAINDLIDLGMLKHQDHKYSLG